MQLLTENEHCWSFDGLEVTEKMRDEVLAYVAERYRSWRDQGYSWEKIPQVMGPPSYVHAPQQNCKSICEFLKELLPREESFFMYDLEQNQVDNFLKELFIKEWGSALNEVVEADGNADPIWDATCAVNDWVADIPLSALLTDKAE